MKTTTKTRTLPTTGSLNAPLRGSFEVGEPGFVTDKKHKYKVITSITDIKVDF